MAAKTGSNQGNWKIKKINSKAGPLNGTLLSSAIRSTSGQPADKTGEAIHLFERDKDNSYSKILVRVQEAS